MIVAILGASPKPHRFAARAQALLIEHGHEVLPVTPRYSTVLGLKAFASLREIEQNVDTVSIYLNPRNSAHLTDELLTLNPKRVIFNPGSESLRLQQTLEATGIHTQLDCTLVLLRSGHF